MQDIDNAFYNWIQGIQNDTTTEILKVITNLGGIVGLFLITLVVVIVLILLKKRKFAIAITLNLMISSMSYILLKSIIQKPRPPIEERLIEETGYSLPSGHMTNNTAFYVLLIYLVSQNVKNKKLRNTLIVLFGCMPIILGFSRIYLRVHYLSDVLAGFCLGMICVTVFIIFIYPKIK